MKITIQSNNERDLTELALEEVSNEQIQVHKAQSLTYALSGEEIQNIVLITIPTGIITNAAYDLIKKACTSLIEQINNKLHSIELPIKITVNGIVHIIDDEQSLVLLHEDISEQINVGRTIEKEQ